MRFLKLTLSYLGTAYAGWQRQPQRVTVQSVLERALLQVTGERIRTVAAGRTDAGVHALRQVVSCATHSSLTNEVLHRALNACLPQDICVLSVEDAPEGFHAVRASVGKRYRYLLQTGPLRDVFALDRIWHVWYPLDVEQMQAAAAYLVGEHDFRSFQTGGSPRKHTVRCVRELIIQSTASLAGQRIAVDMEANGFLYNMARNIVGTLVEVGRGKLKPSDVACILHAADRRRAGPTAPPHGLYLVDVQLQWMPPPSQQGDTSQ
jgi:tRNA pseudouridine38-40 synthase